MKIVSAPLILLALVAGCSAPPAPKDTFFRLEVAQPSTRFERPPLPGVLEVDRLEADGAVGERALAYATRPEGPLERYRYEFWSEPPGVLVRDRFAAILREAGAAATVVTPDLRVPADWTLRGKVRRFEQLAGSGRAAVELHLAVVNARNGTLVMQQTYAAGAAMSGPTVEAGVEAIGRAVSEIAARFVADLGRIPEIRP